MRASRKAQIELDDGLDKHVMVRNVYIRLAYSTILERLPFGKSLPSEPSRMDDHNGNNMHLEPDITCWTQSDFQQKTYLVNAERGRSDRCEKLAKSG